MADFSENITKVRKGGEIEGMKSLSRREEIGPAISGRVALIIAQTLHTQ